jgi:hypothetical protein
MDPILEVPLPVGPFGTFGRLLCDRYRRSHPSRTVLRMAAALPIATGTIRRTGPSHHEQATHWDMADHTNGNLATALAVSPPGSTLLEMP